MIKNFKFSIFNFQITLANFAIIAIIILATVLRVWVLDKYPAGLNADEAAIGYNAFSLIQTGRDEYGDPFPLAFKSFGDYKPGLYFYFVIPTVALFGLNEWGVRLPSALLGVGTVWLIYLLTKKIFESKTTGILAALLLAVSPWHLHFSRGGWETNSATFFITLGVLLFVSKTSNPRYLFYSFLSFLISMYLYQSPRLVVPVMVVFLVAFYFRKVFVNYRKLLIYAIILAVLTIPLAGQFIGGGGSERFSGLSFLSDLGPQNRINELRGDHGGNTPAAKLLHNKAVAYGINFLGHYLDHFSPNFLFINGDPIIRNKVPETGQFYLICAVFLAAGLFFLIRQGEKKYEYSKLLIIWILASPLASSMTYQTPHAVRALTMVIPLTIVMSFGLWQLILVFRKLSHKFIFGNIKYTFVIAGVSAVLIGFFTFEVIHYLESYYVHYPRRYPLSWEYGFEEMVQKLSYYEKNYKKVIITDRYDQPYILVLFYKQFDPVLYQPQAVLSPRDRFNFGTVRSFENYEFREIKKDELKTAKDTLFIGTDSEIPEDAEVIDQVKFPNGENAFVFAKT